MNDLLNQVHHADIFDLCARLPDQSVDMVLTDPPYYGVVGDDWDNAWTSLSEFMGWVSRWLGEFQRVLKPNGSLYVFASHKLHARIEMAISERFNVLNNIVWVSNGATTKRADRSILRGYLPTTEHCIFAEQRNGDAVADELAGFTDAETRLKRSIFGEYLAQEFSRAGVTRKQIATLFPSITGNTTGCVSNWLLGYNCPTPEQYEAMRQYLNSKNGGEYLRTEYEELRTQYEELRQQYEELRQQYEALRRPFDLDQAGANETNVWYFPPTLTGRIHPTQKPLAMFEHIVKVSSRPDDIIFDPFCGSGTTAIAARNCGRQFIVGDMLDEYVQVARDRLALPYTVPMFDAPPPAPQPEQLPLFSEEE